MTSGRRVQVRAFGTLLLVILLAGPAFAQAPTYPGATWTRTSSPEQLGWLSEKLKEAKAYATTIMSAAVLIVAAYAFASFSFSGDQPSCSGVDVRVQVAPG